MKIRVLSQLISLVLLILFIAMLGGCGTLFKAEMAVDQIGDQVEEHIEQAVTPSGSGDTAALTLEEAQQIALDHAGLTADQVNGLHGHFDVDDGVPEYEVEFIQNGVEHDYTIHADTGEILEFDKDND